MQTHFTNGNSHSPLPPEYTLSQKAEQILSKEINNLNPYGEDSPLLQGQYPYPVIFEPIRHIKLSRSTYKVTSFIDFTPHIRTFENFEKYLDDLSRDMNDTERLGALDYIQASFREEFDKIEQTADRDLVERIMDIKDKCEFDIGEICRKVTKYVNSCYGLVRNMCNTKRKYRKLVSIIQYIRQDFMRTKNHFYKAIDHVQDKTVVGNETKREKRSLEKDQLILQAYDQIDTNDEKLAFEILEKLGKIDLETGKRQTRHKIFGLMSWIMGWGILSNARNIKTIKKNIRTLYLQNVLQEKQIQDLAHYLNLTATHVQLQGKMLNEIQTRLENIDFQLVNLHLKLDYHIHVSDMLMEMITAVNRLLAGLISIRDNVDKIYEYMRVMSTHKVHPALLPPEPLRNLLRHIKEKMRENPRLELPYDPDENIWKYYEVMKVTPIIVEDLMVVLLTIPLADKSLTMNVYKAHNLPAVNTEEGKPPLQIIYMGNGCEGFSPSIMIPARSELTSRYQIIERKDYFLVFNTKYESMHALGPWIALSLHKLPEEVIEKLIKRLPELPPLTSENLGKRIGNIDEDYPVEIPIPVLFACQIGGLILLVLGGLGMGWKIYKTRKELQGSLAMFVKGDNKGKDFQKLISTLMNVYTGITPKAAPTPSTSAVTSGTPSSQKAEEAAGLHTTPAKKPRKDDQEKQIEEAIMSVLKKGSEVKKLGKFYEKQQTKL